MAHFAKIDNNNIVQDVLAFDISDNELPSIPLPPNWYWLRTSYNSNIRKNYAGVGYTYDKSRDAFIPIKPFDSYILNEETCRWEAPVPYPAGAMEAGIMHRWNESIKNWVKEPTQGE
jgi:hypothetical protein